MQHERGVTTLDPWGKGVNNRSHERRLPDETVRNAVNVDFQAPGDISRREGFTKVYSAVNTKGGFSCELGVYFVEGMHLKQLGADNTAVTLYSGITGSTFAYRYFNGVLYFSDGVLGLKITASGVSKWGMTPPSAPALSSVSGVYGAGTYLAATCWVDAQGVESGASALSSITVLDGSGIVFSALPPPSDPQAVILRLYLSTANGKELYHVADTTSTSYTVAAGRYDEGTVLDSLFVSPPPAGRVIRFYAGRAYIADANGIVWYSDPFSFDRFRLGEGFLQFPAAADVMEPVDGGIFFAYGDRTEFYVGTPEEGFQITKKFNYGGVYGSGSSVPNSDKVTWQSQRGTVIGAPGGECQNVQEANVAVESAESAATLIRESNGLRQIITSLHQPTSSPLAASSWIDAEVIRRGA